MYANTSNNTAYIKTTDDRNSRQKDVQKLQRTVVDSLEDVKAQQLVVFDTEHISSLFERVVIASGTSNRQTKALAASVRDKVREAGFPKPRIEGEDNGEWIIVDCGAVVVHIMQPTIRQYYNLEELWGENLFDPNWGLLNLHCQRRLLLKLHPSLRKHLQRKLLSQLALLPNQVAPQLKRPAEVQTKPLRKKPHLKFRQQKSALKKHLLKSPPRDRDETMGCCSRSARPSMGPKCLGRLR